eukprot:sb/3465469/
MSYTIETTTNWNSSLFFSSSSPITSHPSHVGNYTTTQLFFGVITTLLVIFGIPANLLSLSYFVRCKGTTVSSILYRSMNIVDCLICVLIAPIAVNYFNSHRAEHPLFFGHVVPCNVWSVLWNVSTRLSIFLIGLMSGARAISLVRPLYRVKIGMVVIPTVIYTFILVIQQTLPYWFNREIVRYSKIVGFCTWFFSDITPIYSLLHKICDVIFIQLEFILPVVPIVISSVVTITKLHTKNRLLGRTSGCRGEKQKKQATITIIILTVVFFVFNTPFLAYQLCSSISVFSNGNIQLIWDTSLPFSLRRWLATIYNIHLIGLNSCINPIVYFLRIKELRQTIRRSNNRSTKPLPNGRTMGIRRRIPGQGQVRNTRYSLVTSSVMTITYPTQKQTLF